jgi:hypothetical protein
MPATGGGARDTIPAGQVVRACAAIAARRADGPPRPALMVDSCLVPSGFPRPEPQPQPRAPIAPIAPVRLAPHLPSPSLSPRPVCLFPLPGRSLLKFLPYPLQLPLSPSFPAPMAVFRSPPGNAYSPPQVSLGKFDFFDGLFHPQEVLLSHESRPLLPHREPRLRPSRLIKGVTRRPHLGEIL